MPRLSTVRAIPSSARSPAGSCDDYIAAEAAKRAREADFMRWEAARKERAEAARLENDRSLWAQLTEAERAVCRLNAPDFARRCER